MKPGSFLVDASRGEERFRIQSLLHDGRSYQIALAVDTLMDDKLVCVKAIAYDSSRMQDKQYVAGRRKALHAEMEFLGLPVHLLPEPLDWIQLDQSETVLSREPVLVYEYLHGDTLYEYVRERYPEGLSPLRALRMFRELARFLSELHSAGYVFRDLDPRHIIISFDDILHIVGCGNATPKGERPNTTKQKLNPSYSAPEIRGEQSGKFLRPTADIYALGALFSFLLTGEEPRDSVENPLSKAAYERLSAIEPPGIALLVARCIQPLAKKRFGRVERMMKFTMPDGLPTPKSDGFGLLQLPAPWSGAEAPDSRSTRSKLSAGPLISVERDEKDEIQKTEPGGCGAVLYRIRELFGMN